MIFVPSDFGFPLVFFRVYVLYRVGAESDTDTDTGVHFQWHAVVARENANNHWRRYSTVLQSVWGNAHDHATNEVQAPGPYHFDAVLSRLKTDSSYLCTMIIR